MTPQHTDTCLRAACLFAPILAIALNGCGGASFSSADTRAGLVCVDDSTTCIQRRQRALGTLTSDPDRSWIRQRATPQTYAAGVRLFALKAKKRDLTCEELKLGRREADRAPQVLKSGSGLSLAQISRSKILASEISQDLKREIRKRCR